MTTRKKQPAPKPVPEEQWQWPSEGGSYQRDPVTGTLTRTDAPPTDRDTEDTDDG